MTDRQAVSGWLERYEAAWRAPGTTALAGLFTPDATYRQGPYEDPVTGLTAIGRMWETERDGPDEMFALRTEIVAVDGEQAVVRAEVSYGQPVRQEYRDLWVLRLQPDGRCSVFEEWPHWPQQPYAAAGPGAAPAGRAFPVVYAADVPAAAAFWQLLGFEQFYVLPADGEPGYAALRRGGSEVAVVARDWPRDQYGVAAGDGPRFDMFVYVGDVDAELGRLRAAGVPVLKEPADLPWGERLATVADPDGNPVVIAHQLADAG